MSIKSSSETVFDPNAVPISIDLVNGALHLLDFLSEVTSKPELFEGTLLDCAIQRYERYWLPLVAKHPGRLLPAPTDIEWIWHCHMLSPSFYNCDCQNVVGKLIDHHLIDKEQRKELIKDSERLWRNEYADVPFLCCDAVNPWFDCEFISALTYNLPSAVARQKLFFYQVSLPHYRDEKFLNNALMRYRKFLYLRCQNPGVFLVPCYDSDLLWHTHMLHPVFYKDDTETYFGTLLPHDDSINDRSPESKHCLSEAKTRNLWRKVFNEKFSHFGAMFRGEPPDSKLYAMTKEDVHKVCTKQAHVRIEKVRIAGLPFGKTFKLKLCYNTGYQNFNRSLFVTENIATVKGNSRNFEDQKINTHFSFDTRYNDKVIACLQQKSGKLCLGTSDTLGEGKIDLQKKIQPLNSKGLTANDDIECGDGLSIGLVWNCPAPVLGPCVLRLEPGDYQSCVMPEDSESMWGPIPLPRLPPGMENHCSVASHKLFNHTRRVVFTVRMIHSEALLMSAIHVFYGDKMTAVAHLVVGDHLPLPTSVVHPKKCVTLNPKEGQRAVLIKNQKGDWGIAVGWWDGFQKRTSGRKGSGSEGHLEVRFYHLLTRQWHYVSFDRLYSLATSKFEIGDCIMEFDSGFIEIDSQRSDIAENLALIFSVALIHVLCQPRPSNWVPKLAASSVTQDEPSTRLGGSEDIALLLAAGVLVATPCNHAIRNLFKKKKMEGNSVFRRGSQREEDDEYEHNGGPAVILHEVDVSPECVEEQAIATSRGSWDAPELGVVVGSGLTVINEQEDGEEEEGLNAEEEECVNAPEESDNESEKNELLALAVVSGEAVDILQGNGGNVEEEEEEEEELHNSSGEGQDDVYDVANFSADTDSQTGLFGNGEDDSDEVDLEDEDDDDDKTGFGHNVSSGNDEDDMDFGTNPTDGLESDHEELDFVNGADAYSGDFLSDDKNDNTNTLGVDNCDVSDPEAGVLCKDARWGSYGEINEVFSNESFGMSNHIDTYGFDGGDMNHSDYAPDLMFGSAGGESDKGGGMDSSGGAGEICCDRGGGDSGGC